MKTTPYRLFVLLLGLAFTVLLFGQSQTAHAQRTASSTVHSFLDDLGIMVDGAFISGLDVTQAQLAANPSLFENYTESHAPVLTPDGTSPVRYNDLAHTGGTLTVLEIVERGTQVTMNVGYAGNVIRADANGHGELDVIQPTSAASWYTVVDGFEIPL